VLPMAGLELPGIGDIITMDPVKLRALRMDDLRRLMQACGISTVGVTSHEHAAMRLVERAAISPSK
jgi:hypothetical protein